MLSSWNVYDKREGERWMNKKKKAWVQVRKNELGKHFYCHSKGGMEKNVKGEIHCMCKNTTWVSGGVKIKSIKRKWGWKRLLIKLTKKETMPDLKNVWNGGREKVQYSRHMCPEAAPAACWVTVKDNFIYS